MQPNQSSSSSVATTIFCQTSEYHTLSLLGNFDDKSTQMYVTTQQRLVKVFERVSDSDGSELGAFPQLPRTVCCWPAEKDILEPYPCLWSVKWNLARSPSKGCWIVSISNMISRESMLRIGQNPIKSRFHIKCEDKCKPWELSLEHTVSLRWLLSGSGFNWFLSLYLLHSMLEEIEVVAPWLTVLYHIRIVLSAPNWSDHHI